MKLIKISDSVSINPGRISYIKGTVVSKRLKIIVKVDGTELEVTTSLTEFVKALETAGVDRHQFFAG